NVTLTLPGFAGLILTIGVAADANVVVFERIKEEVRAGRSVRAAIGAGYGKGFHTILDANVVTVITALIIYLIAVADVKGFALMLGIDFKGGTQITFFTPKAYSQGALKSFMAQHGQRDAVVQGAGKSFNGDFKQWQIRTRSLKPTDQNDLTQGLKNDFGAFKA